MNNHEELFEDELVQKVRKLYLDTGVLIISSSKTTRVSLKKIISLVGVPTGNITVADDFATAKNIIANEGPGIIFSNLFLDEAHTKGAIEIQKLHKEIFPNRLKTIFGVITEIDRPYIMSYTHKHKFDSFMHGAQTFQDLANEVCSIFTQKTEIKPSQIVEFRLNELINLKEPQKVLDYLKSNETKDMEEARINWFKAEAYKQLGENEKSFDHYQMVCDDDLNYSASRTVINTYFEEKKYQEAYLYVKVFLNAYNPLPEEIPTILKCFLFNKKYKELIDFCKIYEDDDNVSAEIKLNIAAALALCGKSLLETEPSIANAALSSSLAFSGGQSFNILHMVVSSLLTEKDNREKCLAIITQYRENFLEQKQFLALEFDVLQYKRSPNEILVEGTTLLKREIKTYTIYEQVIASSIQVGRRKEAIEDIVFEACKDFPTYSDQFKRYMTNL